MAKKQKENVSEPVVVATIVEESNVKEEVFVDDAGREWLGVDEIPEGAIFTEEGEKTIDQLADEVMRGAHGSGRERMISLGEKYFLVQQEVNKRIKAAQHK